MRGCGPMAAGSIVGVLILAGLIVEMPAVKADRIQLPAVVGDTASIAGSLWQGEVIATPTVAYPVQDLGTLGGGSSFALAINNLGQVVGYSYTATGAYHAFLWQDGAMADLGALVRGYSSATSINDLGQVVGGGGNATGAWHAFLWQDGVATDLGTLGGGWSSATGINDLGQVVGSSLNATGAYHAFLWQDGAMADLGSYPFAPAINDLGQVVVDVAIGDFRPPYHAFLWQDGVATDLGTLGGIWAFGRAINDLGQVVGESAITCDAYPFMCPVNAFLWQDGAMADLGSLGGDVAYDSTAHGINNLGQVVGSSWNTMGEYHAFLWQDGAMADLGTLGGSISEAYAINDFGKVVGWSGPAFGIGHAVLWTVPSGVPPPVTTLDEALNGDSVPLSNGGSTVSNAVTFSFSVTDSDLVAGFTCTLDGVPSSCSSPVSYAGLAPGSHRFEVYAYDALGRHGDPVPTFNWTVFTSAEAARALMEKVRSMGQSTGTTNSLLDPLHVADTFLSNDRPSDDYKACRQLRSFIDQVSLYELKGRVSAEQARSLELDATEIMIALGCP